jgi:hypothetical protein
MPVDQDSGFGIGPGRGGPWHNAADLAVVGGALAAPVRPRGGVGSCASGQGEKIEVRGHPDRDVSVELEPVAERPSSAVQLGDGGRETAAGQVANPVLPRRELRGCPRGGRPDTRLLGRSGGWPRWEEERVSMAMWTSRSSTTRRAQCRANVRSGRRSRRWPAFQRYAGYPAYVDEYNRGRGTSAASTSWLGVASTVWPRWTPRSPRGCRSATVGSTVPTVR